MRAPRALLLLALLAASAPTPIAAQDAGQTRPVEIVDADAAIPETPPGSLVTKALFVSNRNSAEHRMVLSVGVPEGWAVIGGEVDLDLDIKNGDTVLVSFHVPSKARAGSYRVFVTVRGADSGSELGSHEIQVRIATVESLVVEMVEAPVYVLAGEVYAARFRVANSGNTVAETLVGVRSSPLFEITSDLESSRLEPGAARLVTIYVKTPATLDAAVRHYLHVSARSSGGATANASSGVDVLPRITGATRLYDVLPLTLTARQALAHAGQDSFAFLGTIEAQGPLSASGRDRFSFFLSVPLDDKGTIFPELPELRISYETTGLSFFAGTKFFALSSLTERSISGAGVEGSVQTGAFRFGGYHLLADRQSASAAETAGYVSYTIADGSTLRLNLLDRAGIPARADQSLLVGAEALWRHPSGAAVAAEYASGDLESGGDAARVAVSGSYPGLSYELGALYASPGYAGPVQDRAEFSASLAAPLTDSLRLSTTLRRRLSSLELVAPAVLGTVTAGLSWSLDRQSSVALSWQQLSSEGNVADPALPAARREETARLSFTRALGSATVGFSAELGEKRASPSWIVTTSERYRGTVSYKPVPSWAIGAAVTLYPAGMEISAQASWKPSDRTQVTVAYGAAEKQSSFYSGRESLRVDVSHRFPAGLRLSAQGTYAPDRSVRRPTDFGVQAELSIPLGLPLRKHAAGRVVGAVTEAASGAGVPDVVLRVGQRVAVTDIKGSFVFPDLPPGTYYVTVDTTRVRQERLVAERLPLAVEVEAWKDTRLDLHVVAPASLTGTVRLYRTGEEGALVPAEPLQDLLVELRRDGEVRKSLTSRAGQFAFRSLPPGTWRLHFSTDGLPPYTAYVENDVDMQLGPGDAPTFEARILPVRREMKMVGEGEIIEEAAPVGTGTDR